MRVMMYVLESDRGLRLLGHLRSTYISLDLVTTSDYNYNW